MSRHGESGELTGSRVGAGDRLLVQEKLGEGGVGVVYKAWDTQEDRPLALKFLRPECTRDPEIATRFEREGRRFARLKHENILKVHGFGRQKSLTFLVTEFVQGRNLGEVLEEDGTFEALEALEVCRQVALALREAHAHQVVHRDLKPENIMLRDSDRLVKVLDFGIAKMLDTQSSFTDKGTYLGTPGYSAPEQIHCKDVDHRADIFPLGAILYEMITGKLAFEGRHTLDVLKSTLSDRPVPDGRFNAEVVAPVAKLIEKMIKKNPRRRHADMAELLAELDTIRESLSGGYREEDKKTIRSLLRSIFQGG